MATSKEKRTFWLDKIIMQKFDLHCIKEKQVKEKGKIISSLIEDYLFEQKAEKKKRIRR